MPKPSAARPAPAASPSTARSLFFPNYSWPREFLRHRVRLSRGVIQSALLDLVRQRSEGRKRGKGEPVPEWCWPFSIASIAKEWGCSDREIRADLADAVKRGLLEDRRNGNQVECRLTCADPESAGGLNVALWEKLPSYSRGPQLVASDDSDDGEELPEEEQKKAACAPLKLRPVTVRAGAPSKPLKIAQGVKSIGFSVDGPGEYKAETTVTAGHIDVSFKLTPSGFKELRNRSGSELPAAVVSGVGVELADQVRSRTGLKLDPPAIRRIERALNGSIPHEFFVDELAAAVDELPERRPGFAVYFAEQQIVEKWRLHQRAGPPAKRDRALEMLEALAAEREGRG